MNHARPLSWWIAATGRILGLSAVMTLLWAVLTKGTGWGFGVIAVVAATLAGLSFAPLPASLYSLSGLGRFLLYFVQESLRGGIDVAWRALHPSLPLEPTWLKYPLSLPQGQARTLFISTVNLLPGTLSAELEGDDLLIHALIDDPGTLAELAQLEMRVAALFAMKTFVNHPIPETTDG